ncbi:SNF2 N and Helicase C domain containing protein, partial [Trichuris trichiura]
TSRLAAVVKHCFSKSSCFFQNRCLDFFETADEDELAIESFENRKGISTFVCDSYRHVIQLQNDMDTLLCDCEGIAADLESHVSRLKESSDSWVSKPALLSERLILHCRKQSGLAFLKFSLELKPYQLIGLNWLILLRKLGVSAVLADEMARDRMDLEKQCNIKSIIPILLLFHHNWLSELNRWCPSLSVLTYYGNAEDRSFIRLEVDSGRLSGFDVVLTTYQLAVGSSQDRAFHKRLGINYAIFDEAHMLKSCNTARYKKLMQLNARQRILLTGTPLQNNLVELVSLMHFVMPDLFAKYAHNLKELLESKIEQAKRIMKTFTLRRLKSEVLEQLPEKHERLELCELTETQAPLYNQLMSYCSDGNVCAMFMQLRKAANHPLLLRSLYNEKAVRKMAKALFKVLAAYSLYEDLLTKSDFDLHKLCCQHKLFRLKLPVSAVLNSAKISALEKILPEAKSQGSKVLLFSQFTMVLDILEVYLQHKKYSYVRMDGSTPVVERKGLIDHFNGSDVFIFLLSTRAGGLGVNLTSANVIILHDIDYNPHNDRQAEDRCHRVGQTKDVYVIKLIAKDTIDETMLACAQRKLLLERKVTAAEDSKEKGLLFVSCRHITFSDEEDIESLLRQVIRT